MIFRMTFGNPIRYYLDGAEVDETAYRRASKKREKMLRRAGVSLQDALESCGFQGRSQTKECWPQASIALAPAKASQIPALMARNKRYGIQGVSYELDKDGLPVAKLADRGARRDLMALEGLFDKNGGYGDDHASNTSPLHREDTVEFDDEMLSQGFRDERGRVERL